MGGRSKRIGCAWAIFTIPAAQSRGLSMPSEQRNDLDFESSRRLKPHRGTIVMVMGILSFFVGHPVLGIIAWVMGKNDLKEMDDGVMDPAGRDNTSVGKICGMISTLITAG